MKNRNLNNSYQIAEIGQRIKIGDELMYIAGFENVTKTGGEIIVKRGNIENRVKYKITKKSKKHNQKK